MDTHCNWMWLPLYTIHSAGILAANWNIQLPKPPVKSAESLGCQAPMARCGFRYVKLAWDSHTANIEDEGWNERQIGGSNVEWQDVYIPFCVCVCVCVCARMCVCVVYTWKSMWVCECRLVHGLVCLSPPTLFQCIMSRKCQRSSHCCLLWLLSKTVSVSSLPMRPHWRYCASLCLVVSIVNIVLATTRSLFIIFLNLYTLFDLDVLCKAKGCIRSM